ncbi:hypothetical protein [Cobetia sp. ICG0124]|uniref:hypothetical protein n=1 Tax=Cobetia sp. ICG0124 TaxID=2053669 RepID=UPI000FD7745C|nr:hypothetical protein [Cobetia sp. ICG0124]AZV30921.1 hypothetical protein CU110_05425 [Cobetia sp. ICG0124]
MRQASQLPLLRRPAPPRPAAAAPAADLKALKTARAAANIAVKKAEKALKTAQDSGECSASDIAALEASVTDARARLAKAESRPQGRQRRPASPTQRPQPQLRPTLRVGKHRCAATAASRCGPAADLKALKTARAAANIAVKKAEKALKTAQDSGEGDIAALEASVTDARARLAKAEADLKAASDASSSQLRLLRQAPARQAQLPRLPISRRSRRRVQPPISRSRRPRRRWPAPAKAVKAISRTCRPCWPPHRKTCAPPRFA